MELSHLAHGGLGVGVCAGLIIDERINASEMFIFGKGGIFRETFYIGISSKS